MNAMNKISHRLSLLFRLLIILYPAIIISMWLNLLAIPTGYFAFSRLPVPVDFNSLSLTLRVTACVIQLISASIVMLGFYYLVQLFNLYSRDIIFSTKNIALIKKTGYTLVAQVLASLVTQPLLSFILTMNAKPGEHMVSIGIGSDEISNLLIGAIVVLVAWVMAEGSKLEEAQALTI